jgi:SAM-dependent methyltransferase
MRALIPAAIEAVDGTAEAIPLADAAADAVTVAQAFHWFRADEALAEIHRVLRPGGRLAILRNERDLADSGQQAFAEILARHRAHPSLEAGFDAEAALARARLYERSERRSFAFEQELDPVAVGASETSIALLDDEARTAAHAEFAALGARVRLRYVTEVVIARARAPRARPR